jgi:hypothetical protein
VHGADLASAALKSLIDPIQNFHFIRVAVPVTVANTRLATKLWQTQGEKSNEAY